MWSPEQSRRRALALLVSAAAAGGLSACGFAPAYGPSGGASRLQGRVAVAAPRDRDGYLLVQRLENRLGRAEAALGAPYLLDADLEIRREGGGLTSGQGTTRYTLTGGARFTLTDTASGAVLLSDRVRGFTGYSATGSTVATLAAERDARARLMVLLADRITDRLVMAAADLPADLGADPAPAPARARPAS